MNHGTPGRGRDPRFDHPEAFCLMWYQDQVTGERERLWNSRDGVTPFVITSPAGNESRHVDWHCDMRIIDHMPKIDDRVFVNLTLERAREYRHLYADKWWDHDREGAPRMCDRTDLWTTKDEAVEYLARRDFWPNPPPETAADAVQEHEGTQPDIVVVDADLLVALMSRERSPQGMPGAATLLAELEAALADATKPRQFVEDQITMHPDLLDAMDKPRLNRKQRRAKKLRPGICPHCHGSGKA